MSPRRTQEEIVAQIRKVKGHDLFGFEWHEYLGALDFEHAKQFLKPGATAVDWNVLFTDDESIRKTIVDYLPFAWGKANNCRGISASRSVSHLIAWTWLLGDDELHAVIADESNYSLYGKPILRAVSERFGVDWRALDDGHWTNYEDSDGVAADVVPALALAA